MEPINEFWGLRTLREFYLFYVACSTQFVVNVLGYFQKIAPVLFLYYFKIIGSCQTAPAIFI